MHLYEISRKGQPKEVESRLVLVRPGGWGQGEWRAAASWSDKNALELRVVLVARHCECAKVT